MTTKNIKHKGFTIIELLVVIVVIGILAAITIISFANVTSKGRTASLAATANNLLQKAVLYKQNNTGTFVGNYPPTLATLTSLPSTDPAYVTGVSLLTSLPLAGTVGTNNNTVSYEICGTNTNMASNAAPSGLVGTNGTPAGNNYLFTTGSAGMSPGATLTGIRIGYWDFTAGTQAYVSEGKLTGADPTWQIGCFFAQT